MTDARTAQTQSILADMTKQVMARHQGVTLTPVGLEQSGDLRDAALVPGATFPSDQPAQAIFGELGIIRDALRRIERYIGPFDTKVAEAIAAAPREPLGYNVDGVTAKPDRWTTPVVTAAPEPDPEPEPAEEPDDPVVKQIDFDKQNAEMQAKVFGPGGTASGGWQCPTHGGSETFTSPKGRVFQRCPTPNCTEFERG